MTLLLVSFKWVQRNWQEKDLFCLLLHQSTIHHQPGREGGREGERGRERAREGESEGERERESSKIQESYVYIKLTNLLNVFNDFIWIKRNFIVSSCVHNRAIASPIHSFSYMVQNTIQKLYFNHELVCVHVNQALACELECSRAVYSSCTSIDNHAIYTKLSY